LCFHCSRYPDGRDLSDIDSAKAFAGHTDDRHRVSVDGDLLPDHIRTACKLAFPESVGEDHGWICTWRLIVRAVEESPERRRDSQHRKIRAGYHFVSYRNRTGVGREVNRGRVAAQDAIEEVFLLLQIPAHRIGHEISASPSRGEWLTLPIDEDQALRL